LAYEKGDVIGELNVNKEVRIITIPDVFLVKDFFIQPVCYQCFN
jgi:hypothetical protein